MDPSCDAGFNEKQMKVKAKGDCGVTIHSKLAQGVHGRRRPTLGRPHVGTSRVPPDCVARRDLSNERNFDLHNAGLHQVYTQGLRIVRL
jgi:hypothetical protein